MSWEWLKWALIAGGLALLVHVSYLFFRGLFGV